MSVPDAELIRALLDPAITRFDLFAEIDSTNTWLLDRGFADQPAPPRLAVAAVQHAGRGRRGRSWIAEPGSSAAFSLSFEREGSAPPAPGLSIAVGCAIADALLPHCPALALKWPNDLLRAGRKCGGILIETRTGRAGDRPILRAVIGVGLNLRAPRDPDALITQPAGGLFEDDQPGLAVEALIALAAGAVFDAWSAHGRDGLAPFVDTWSRLDAWHGRQVELSDGGRVVARGQSLGIDADGALRVLGEAGERRMIAGDLSLRTAPEAL